MRGTEFIKRKLSATKKKPCQRSPISQTDYQATTHELKRPNSSPLHNLQIHSGSTPLSRSTGRPPSSMWAHPAKALGRFLYLRKSIWYKLLWGESEILWIPSLICLLHLSLWGWCSVFYEDTCVWINQHIHIYYSDEIDVELCLFNFWKTTCYKCFIHIALFQKQKKKKKKY